MITLMLFIGIFFPLIFQAQEPFPIQFAISEHKIVKAIPKKDTDFAFIIPGCGSTYIYKSEEDYYKDYQRSYFAITCAKGGWDCMRHYEILANGCIPFFLDLDRCCPQVMPFLPKELIHEAMCLEGVSYPTIDHTKFNSEKYYEILEKLLHHTRSYLTTKSMAQYLLNTVNYKGGKILFLGKDVAPNYMPDCILAGLKELYGDKVIDVPKITYLYTTYTGDISKLYGKGITYTKIIEDQSVDRNNIEQRIKDKDFELIIYGAIHQGLMFYDKVVELYPQNKVVYICGEDCHACPYKGLSNLFLREFDPFPPYQVPYNAKNILGNFYQAKSNYLNWIK